jgi:hypothetical protein
MRQRSVQFLAFVGASTAFLVGTGLKSPSRDGTFYVLAACASVCSLISVVLAVFLLLSLKGLRPVDWSFRLFPSKLIEWIEPEVPQPDETDYLRALALQYEDMADKNTPLIALMRKYYVLFLFFGFTQLILWAWLAWAKA